MFFNIGNFKFLHNIIYYLNKKWKIEYLFKKWTGNSSKSELEIVQKANWKWFKKWTGNSSKSELEMVQKVNTITNNYSNIKNAIL